KLQTIAIAKEALSTMIASSGVNDTYRMYLLARRDGVDFNLGSIGDDFDIPYKGPFDREYMQSLFAYGYQKGRAGYPWQTAPPGRVMQACWTEVPLEASGARCYGRLCARCTSREAIMFGMTRAIKCGAGPLLAALMLFAVTAPWQAETGRVRLQITKAGF